MSKKDLLSGIDEIRSLLQDLDGCLENLVRAEDQLQATLRRIPRFERSFDYPYEIWSRIRQVVAVRHQGFAPRAAPRFN